MERAFRLASLGRHLASTRCVWCPRWLNGGVEWVNMSTRSINNPFFFFCPTLTLTTGRTHVQRPRSTSVASTPFQVQQSRAMSSEVKKAAAAQPGGDTIFGKVSFCLLVFGVLCSAPKGRHSIHVPGIHTHINIFGTPSHSHITRL